MVDDDSMGGARPRDVVVLLGSDWSALESWSTRWRNVIDEWTKRADVGTVVAVDYPSWHPRRVLMPTALVTERRSWHPAVRNLHALAPLAPHTGLADRIGWALLARQLRKSLSLRDGFIAVAATPLWVPLLGRLGAARTAFDVIDDWRLHPWIGPIRGRVDAGLRAARAVDVCTAVTRTLADSLAADGLRAAVVGNGVDIAAFAAPGTSPPGLPDGPFAVYVGRVEARLDLAALEAIRAAQPELPIVIAGVAADAALAAHLTNLGVQLLGTIDRTLVPGLLHRAAIGLLPHHAGGIADGQSSLKLLEYLAAGLPVVATPGPEVLDHPRVLVGHSAALPALTRQALTLGRGPVPDPAVAERGWDRVADQLWQHVLGRASS